MMDWTLYPFEQDDTPCLTALEGIKIITGVHPANKISGGVHPGEKYLVGCTLLP